LLKHWVVCSEFGIGHHLLAVAHGAKASDFKRLLTHPIKPVGGPEVLTVTLEDAAKFIGVMKPWRQPRPYWDRCGA
jgi:hypothetical protein